MEEETFDIQRSIPIVKMFLKKIKGTPAEQEEEKAVAPTRPLKEDMEKDFGGLVNVFDD